LNIKAKIIGRIITDVIIEIIKFEFTVIGNDFINSHIIQVSIKYNGANAATVVNVQNVIALP